MIFFDFRFFQEKGMMVILPEDYIFGKNPLPHNFPPKKGGTPGFGGFWPPFAFFFLLRHKSQRHLEQNGFLHCLKKTFFAGLVGFERQSFFFLKNFFKGGAVFFFFCQVFVLEFPPKGGKGKSEGGIFGGDAHYKRGGFGLFKLISKNFPLWGGSENKKGLGKNKKKTPPPPPFLALAEGIFFWATFPKPFFVFKKKPKNLGQGKKKKKKTGPGPPNFFLHGMGSVFFFFWLGYFFFSFLGRETLFKLGGNPQTRIFPQNPRKGGFWALRGGLGKLFVLVF